MTLDIKMSAEKPRRQTYANIARRFGEDRPASRYEEAVLDLQPDVNFHYRPTWDPAHELFDPSRTAVKMADWYALRDPRQFYYASWNMARGAMAQASDRNFGFVEERNLAQAIGAGWGETVKFYLLPFRHYEWAANMNGFYAADYGYGSAFTSAAAFSAADRLGMAQVIGRIGLLLDGASGASLAEAKKRWLEDATWQPVRRLAEDSFVIEDWFETWVAQNLAFDGIFHPLLFRRFETEGQRHGATAISLLTTFMSEWYGEHGRWVDAVIKTAAAESPENRALLGGWFRSWSARAVEAATPLAVHVLGEGAEPTLLSLHRELEARAARLGLQEG